MSLLNPQDAVPAPTTPVSTDARAAFTAALQRVEDAFAVALRQAEEKVAAVAAERAVLEREHAALAAEHQELKQRHAETEQKLAVLKEVRAKLDGL